MRATKGGRCQRIEARSPRTRPNFHDRGVWQVAERASWAGSRSRSRGHVVTYGDAGGGRLLGSKPRNP